MEPEISKQEKMLAVLGLQLGGILQALAVLTEGISDIIPENQKLKAVYLSSAKHIGELGESTGTKILEILEGTD